MWLHGGYTTFFPYISSDGAGSDDGTTVCLCVFTCSACSVCLSAGDLPSLHLFLVFSLQLDAGHTGGDHNKSFHSVFYGKVHRRLPRRRCIAVYLLRRLKLLLLLLLAAPEIPSLTSHDGKHRSRL